MLAATLASAAATSCSKGPPGTGKSTLLRAVADGAGFGVEFVEGNAELTPARLVGHHDPALVLETGYTPDIFVDGPLITALREGSLLYIEELNRVPEETLNVLVGALAEGEIHVPRLGRVPAARELPADRGDEPVRRRRHGAREPGDLGPHVPDLDRLPGRGRRARDRRAGHGAAEPARGPAVELTRLTREHAQVRMGASVRGAIDLVRLGRELSALRGEPEPAPGDPTFADAAIAALSGRLRLDEGAEQTPEAIILELIERLVREARARGRADGKSRGPRLRRAGPVSP